MASQDMLQALLRERRRAAGIEAGELSPAYAELELPEPTPEEQDLIGAILHDVGGPIGEPIPGYESTAREIDAETARADLSPVGHPSVSPDYRLAVLEDARSRALRSGEHASALSGLLASIRGSVDRFGRGVTGLPQDPTGGIDFRRAAAAPLESAEREAAGIDRMIAGERSRIAADAARRRASALGDVTGVGATPGLTGEDVLAVAGERERSARGTRAAEAELGRQRERQEFERPFRERELAIKELDSISKAIRRKASGDEAKSRVAALLGGAEPTAKEEDRFFRQTSKYASAKNLREEFRQAAAVALDTLNDPRNAGVRLSASTPSLQQLNSYRSRLRAGGLGGMAAGAQRLWHSMWRGDPGFESDDIEQLDRLIRVREAQERVAQAAVKAQSGAAVPFAEFQRIVARLEGTPQQIAERISRAGKVIDKSDESEYSTLTASVQAQIVGDRERWNLLPLSVRRRLEGGVEKTRGEKAPSSMSIQPPAGEMMSVDPVERIVPTEYDEDEWEDL